MVLKYVNGVANRLTHTNFNFTTFVLSVGSVNNLYKNEGIRKIITYCNLFHSHALNNSLVAGIIVDSFINTFCEYELADNNYMPLFASVPGSQSIDDGWFKQLTTEQVLKYLTYIIWTDRIANNYFLAKVEDNTVYRLIKRLEELEGNNVLQPSV